MEVRNKRMEKLSDSDLEEVSGGLDLERPLNTSLLTDDKIKKENEKHLLEKDTKLVNFEVNKEEQK